MPDIPVGLRYSPDAFPYAMPGAALSGRERLAEAEPRVDRAGQTLQTQAHPAAAEVNLHLLEMACGGHADVLAEFLASDRLTATLVPPHALVRSIQTLSLLAQVKLGETSRAEATLAGLDENERQSAQGRPGLASLRLAQNDPQAAYDPQAAVTALVPVLDGSVIQVGVQRTWVVEALLLEATARDVLGDPGAGLALERALEVAEPDRELVPFLLHHLSGLLERHAQRARARAALAAEILSLLPRRKDGAGSTFARRSTTPPEARLHEPLSQAEIRVLRHLPSCLSVAEIAGQLYLSANTVRTHMRHLYAKLEVHRRHEAVERARALGLLAPGTPEPN